MLAMVSICFIDMVVRTEFSLEAVLVSCTYGRDKSKFSWFIFTVRKSSCCKVMFSQMCVILSVHWGVGACVAGEMATEADGTHPAGMHSCITNVKRVDILPGKVWTIFCFP